MRGGESRGWQAEGGNLTPEIAARNGRVLECELDTDDLDFSLDLFSALYATHSRVWACCM